MKLARARYLVRFDDICATMHWSIWEPLEEKLLSLGIKPIMAIVPDNQDPKLEVEVARSNFWERVRRWQDWGWALGVHGYQHNYCSRGKSLVGSKRQSEFAGLPREEQLMKLSRALEIFSRENISPAIWVAPGHSFDAETLLSLKALRLQVLSDGYFWRPGRDGSGIVWVPQQLWRFRPLPFGIWTVCSHINNWSKDDLFRFTAQLERYVESIVDLNTVLREYGSRDLGRGDFLCKLFYQALLQLRFG